MSRAFFSLAVASALALSPAPVLAQSAPKSIVKRVLNSSGATYDEGINDGVRDISQFHCSASTHLCNLLTSGAAISGTPGVENQAPIGNGLDTWTGLNLQMTTAQAMTREYGVALGMIANTGSGAGTAGPGDKATLYVAMRCLTGAIACWATNPLTALEGPLNSNFFSAYTNEFDYNILGMTDAASKNTLGQSSGGYSTYGKVDLSKVVYVGNTTLTGYADTSGIHANFAIAVSGFNHADGSPLWERGVWFPYLAGARLADVQSDDSAQTVLADFGSHNTGIDLSKGTYSRVPILLGPNGAIQWVAADGTTVVNGIYLDNNAQSPLLHLGNGAASIELHANTYPITNGGQALGGTNLRFSGVYAFAFQLPNTGAFQWLRADGTATNALYVSADNVFHAGNGLASIAAETSVMPASDGAQSIGASGTKFNTIYSYTTSTNTVRFPAGGTVQWPKSDGTELNSLYVSSDTLLHLGEGSASINSGASIYPEADNTYALGASSLRFSAVYAGVVSASSFQVGSTPGATCTGPLSSQSQVQNGVVTKC